MKPMTIRQPYQPKGTAGHTVEEWITMSSEDKAKARVVEMRQTAERWAWIHWRESMGVPATVVADAQSLLAACDRALQALQENSADAIIECMDATAIAAELNRWTAIQAALTEKKKGNAHRVLGSKSSAEQNAQKAEKTRQRIVELWNESKLPERNRASVIAERIGISPKQVREHLRKANLR
ncbi:hypothetical protein R0137_11135 [Congregibacter brevis]|uniref:Uncharacterized protein n=1 Tax=Congregibacter brevis TaxID=3081201 RepID=A0ABZ0I9P5_9GAMM|nr:hypothetical protein R0137_11135 [Congregibacter sp. IMCC45268]